MTEDAKRRRNFRQTKLWTTLRHKKFVDSDGIDYITGGKLTKYANLHHLDLNKSHYYDLSDESHFILLNRQTHETIHLLYNASKRLGVDELLERLREVLNRMHELSD